LCNPCFFLTSLVSNLSSDNIYFRELTTAWTTENMMEACTKGNRFAQKALYEQYAASMFHVCLRILKSREAAEDALQEAFINVFKNIHLFQNQSTPGAWIKRIVINTCIDHLRMQKHKMAELDDKVFFISDNQEEADSEYIEWSVKAIKAAMNELPDGYRTIFSLYAFEGYDHMEIAQILSISESNSKTQYHRAKLKIKEWIKNYDSDE
jgi:RNA polymerase sigma factor (sigma-70 family)